MDELLQRFSAGGVRYLLIGGHLLSAKEAANRPQDQLDIAFLREIHRAGKLT